jgi:hypothetical protein
MMMKHATVMAAILAMVASVHGAILPNAIVSEDFSYDTGSLDASGSATNGWADSWNAEDVNVVSGGVTGNAAEAAATGGDLTFSRAWDDLTYDDGDSYWYSVDVYSDDFSAATVYVSLFEEGVWGMGFQIAGGDAKPQIGAFDATGGTALIDGQWHTIVGKITFSDTDGQDTSEIWVDPVGSPVEGTGYVKMGDVNLNRTDQAFGMKVKDGMTIRVDNFSVVPEPATLALLGLGAVGMIRRRRA